MPAEFDPPPTQATTSSGSRPICSRHWRPGLAANHRLEVPHNHRKRMRSDDGTEDVVRVGDRRHPIPHGFIDRVAERSRAGRHRSHLGSEHPHVEHVEPLAADVFLTHVDHAVEPESGAGRRGGHAVLPGPGFGDDPFLAHAQGQAGPGRSCC